MKYFVVRGETRHLDQHTRAELRGDFLQCSAGITHYEMTGPEGGEVVVCAGSLTTPLFYWDQLVGQLHSHMVPFEDPAEMGLRFHAFVDAAKKEKSR